MPLALAHFLTVLISIWRNDADLRACLNNEIADFDYANLFAVDAEYPRHRTTVQSPNPVNADDLADPVQRRVSQESHQTLSLCVPVNSLRPMSFATSACTVSLVGVWALTAVFTIGTSIR
jgi:hypothetical protein